MEIVSPVSFSSPITLSDFLNCKDWDDQLSMANDFYDDDVMQREDCKSLGVILSRLFSIFRRKKKEKRNGQERIVAVIERERTGNRLDGVVSLQPRCSMNGLDCETGAVATEVEVGVESQQSYNSGTCKKETLVNMGIGFGLLYLLAPTKNELNQMIELRKQMEIIFQNGKKELDLHRKDALAMPFIYNNNDGYTTTDVADSLNSNGCLSLQTYTTPGLSGSCEWTERPQNPVNGDIFTEEKCAENIHQLEAEFEAELECLQLRVDNDGLFAHHHKEKIEVDAEEIDSEGSLTTSNEEVIDEQVYPESEHGVCPYELKIRLLELIQEKHEERIKELDAALEHAQKRLVEKEMEVLWWKDTAQLVSKRVDKF